MVNISGEGRHHFLVRHLRRKAFIFFTAIAVCTYVGCTFLVNALFQDEGIPFSY